MLDKQTFNDWIDNPATQFYMSYLLDFRSSILEGANMALEDGKILSEIEQQVISAQCVLLKDMGTPEKTEFDEQSLYESIEEFYNKEELDNEDNPSMGPSNS